MTNTCWVTMRNTFSYWTYTIVTCSMTSSCALCRKTGLRSVYSLHTAHHVLQSLADVPFAVMKKKYQKELFSYNFSVAGAKMNHLQFFRVLVPAFTQAFTAENIRKGFMQTGIYPIDPNTAKLKDLGPSIITDKCKSLCVENYTVDCIYWCFFRLLVAVLGRNGQAGQW